jgi:phospholipase/lecithinase/hemolysin
MCRISTGELRLAFVPSSSSNPLHKEHSVSIIDHPYSRLVVFGDSFLDTGHFSDVTAQHGATWPARSGTNPQWMWIEYVAAALGLAADPASAGGTNHAQAYALADGVMESIPGLDHLGLRPSSVAEQVAAFLTHDHLSGSDLVIVNGGGNDALLSVLAGTGTDAIEAAATSFAATLATLAATGARVITVSTPDLGLSPMAGSGAGGDANPISAAVDAYNRTAANKISAAGIKVAAIDGFNYFRELVARASDYGLTNVVAPSYPDAGIGAFLCGPDQQVEPDVNGYLFSDAIHVSATGHRMFGAYATGAIASILG